MKFGLKALVAASALLSFSGVASASTTINFESETQGSKANGYALGGVSFSAIGGGSPYVYSGSEVNGTRGLLAGADSASYIQMVFAGLSTDLSLAFGNDEACVPGNCYWNSDRAILTLFLDGAQVASTFVLFNQNNIADQRIGIDGVVFNSATFAFGNANGVGTLNEAIDDITFSAAVAAVPEPGTWAMMLLGFGAIGAGLRRRRTAPDLLQLA